MPSFVWRFSGTNILRIYSFIWFDATSKYGLCWKCIFLGLMNDTWPGVIYTQLPTMCIETPYNVLPPCVVYAESRCDPTKKNTNRFPMLNSYSRTPADKLVACQSFLCLPFYRCVCVSFRLWREFDEFQHCNTNTVVYKIHIHFLICFRKLPSCSFADLVSVTR